MSIYVVSNYLNYLYTSNSSSPTMETILTTLKSGIFSFSTGLIYFTTMAIGSGNAIAISATSQIVNTVSLRAYKTNEIQFTASDILNLEPKLFNWKDSGAQDLGLIVEDAIDKNLNHYIYYDGSGPRNYKDRSLIAGLISLAKIQQKQIENQEQRITYLETLLNRP